MRLSRTYSVEEFYDRLPTMYGKPAKCDSFRTTHSILRFSKTIQGRTEIKYVDPGCGQFYYCLHCGKHIKKKRAAKTRNLYDALREAFPNIPVVHLVFTLPHDHEMSLREDRVVYRQLNALASKLIKKHWPDSAALQILHTWSSENPENQHLHIHALIFCLTKKGDYITPYRDADKIRETWQKLLQYHSEVSIHLQYYYPRHFRRVYHVIKYLYRSPIEDFCGDFPRNLTAPYVIRVSMLYHVHRVRWTGWLGNRGHIHNLAKLGITIVDAPPVDGWTFDKSIYGFWDFKTGNFICNNGDIIYSEEITDIDTTLSSPLFLLARPP